MYKRQDLFYAEDGTLIKAVEDIDNNNNYQPNMVPEVLKNFINEKYPQATIVDIEVEKGITEIDILHENKAKELHFNSEMCIRDRLYPPHSPVSLP